MFETVGLASATTPMNQCLPCAQNVQSSFFFCLPSRSMCPVFCIAHFLCINSIHIYTKQDVLWKSVCKCHSATVRCASALKPGMTEQGTGALSAVSLLFRMEQHHPFSNAVARLDYSSKHFRLALSTSLFCSSPLCPKFVVAWRARMFLPCCFVFVVHTSRNSRRCLPVETNTAPRIALGMPGTKSSVPHVLRMHSALSRTL